MAQLKMYWLPTCKIKEYELPSGYSFSNFKTESDKTAWCDCCRNGLIGDDEGEQAFTDSIEKIPDIDPYNDIFFLDFNGEHIATVTAYVIKDENVGDVHMVGMKTEYRGKGLSKYLCMTALKHLKAKNIKYALLTTDEWRKSAVKSYLSAGFLPVEYEMGMTDRWQDMLEELGIDSVQMLFDDATEYKTIYRASKAKN